MKKISLLCLICMTAIIFVGCASEDPQYVTTETDDVYLQYEKSKELVREYVNHTYSSLQGTATRGVASKITPSEFLQYILNMPQQQLDSLMQNMSRPEVINAIEQFRDKREEVLINNSSYKEVALLYAFADDYISIGGQSIDMIKQYTKSTSPLIQKIMIFYAVYIDELISDYPFTRFNHACLIKVLRDHGLDAAADTILTIVDWTMIDVAPEIGLPDVLYQLGVDASQVSMIINEYTLCNATSW